jgi:hypothetical protein
MTSLLLFYSSWYLIIGFISSWLINQVIIKDSQEEPYTSTEIVITILLWPVNVLIFITNIVISLFK